MEVERERGSLSRYFCSVCIFLRQPTLSFCCIHGLDIGSTRSKMEDVQQHPYKLYKGCLAQFVVLELVQDVQDRKQIVTKICMLCSLQASFEQMIS
jgi:hypothetical protein